MICLCGYAYEGWTGHAQEDEKFVGKRIGQKKFKEIIGNFIVHNETQFGYIDYVGREVSLYACPECNTIQLKD